MGPAIFRKVDCVDASETGFSYLATAPLSRQSLVVSVRQGGVFKHALADVVSCAPTMDCGEKFRIVCRYCGDLPPRQVQILRQIWLLESPSDVVERPHESDVKDDAFSCEQLF